MSNAFRKGVQYNMKIILRGDVMTGKSNLFQRLQGAEFDSNYSSTPQIQVANIPWRYKDSNDIVKIEVWDVVDKAHNKSNTVKPNMGIKLEHNEMTPKESSQEQRDESDPSMGLDATTVNVYRNTHAAILIFDITKPWTFDYVNKELENVPETVSVLVLGNFCDKIQERKVELDTIHATLYQHNQERIKKGAIKPNLIRYAETSMQTGMGLKYIYEYLGVPFLQLMIESLNKQIELKAVEIVDLLEVLDTDDHVPDEMHRRKGQDNFNQPSDLRLARQQEEMRSVWDQELEAIAVDHPTILDKTESPPTEPVRTIIEDNIQLISDEVPPAIDIGDELADDWFGEDSGTIHLQSSPQQNESDNEGPGNPMVLDDEDIEPTLFYNHESASTKQDNEKEEEEEQPSHSYQSAPLFKSDFNDIWNREPEVISNSEDEDNVIHRVHSISLMSSPLEQISSPFIDSPTFHYEEIGEKVEAATENPWSVTTDDDKENSQQKREENSSSKKKKHSKKKSNKKKRQNANK
ncbi:P-loop containing nucleoside triphosphate hydrolase protein [Cokeromyces recurvatus]|uniref:P-loop containing nucleoside triphosphate hydrolase protein n=1 Tax=Cokeromyces recurvatus TaxID=90255 RepID=UPI00221FDD77|nr:P-loop containing nucleoside triphosphate hydrolase protein [Cokeromyces recurvatus]KAI7900764.1 P-loop containing nucleoside triphosphate hydrolase protein [Cokeromyces recurvatus]